jgi:hypothetical protein
MRKRCVLISLLLTLIASLTVGADFVFAQESTVAKPTSTETAEASKADELKSVSAHQDFDAERETEQAVQNDSGHETSGDYAFLNMYSPIPKSEFVKWLKSTGWPDRRGWLSGKPAFRPFAHWVAWANKRQPARFALPFLFVMTLVSWTFLPRRMEIAETECTLHYWRSLGLGCVVALIALGVMRCILVTQIGWPLGILTVGAFQLSVILGGAIVDSIIGKSIFNLLKLDRRDFFAKHTFLRSSLQYLSGAVVLTALLQLGAPFGLPRMGTRLVLLLCMAGLGALFRSRKATGPVQL